MFIIEKKRKKKTSIIPIYWQKSFIYVALSDLGKKRKERKENEKLLHS